MIGGIFDAVGDVGGGAGALRIQHLHRNQSSCACDAGQVGSRGLNAADDFAGGESAVAVAVSQRAAGGAASVEALAAIDGVDVKDALAVIARGKADPLRRD